MANPYTAFFSAYNASQKAGNRSSKEEVVLDFTKGRTASLRDLSQNELKQLVDSLNNLSGFKPKVTNDKADRMRKAIIAIFKKMGRPTTAAVAWAEKQGVRGIKKPFNEYTTQELHVLIQIAEKVLSDWQKAIRKSISE